MLYYNLAAKMITAVSKFKEQSWKRSLILKRQNIGSYPCTITYEFTTRGTSLISFTSDGTSTLRPSKSLLKIIWHPRRDLEIKVVVNDQNTFWKMLKLINK